MSFSRAAAVLAVGLLLGVPPARAEVQLQKMRWEQVRKADARAVRYEDAPPVRFAGPKLAGKLRARLTLLNRGPKSVEGILLRYSVAGKLAPKDKPESGAWAVAFMLEEKRVPKLGPNEIQEVTLDPSLLAIHLLKAQQAGYALQAVKLQVTLEPRQGETGALQTLESELSLAP